MSSSKNLDFTSTITTRSLISSINLQLKKLIINVNSLNKNFGLLKTKKIRRKIVIINGNLISMMWYNNYQK